MKLFIALTFAIAAIINAPVSCAHALGMETGDAAHHGAADETPANMMDDGAHAEHHQHSHGQTTDTETPHQGCDLDCTGGVGCDGCAIGATAVLTQDGETARVAPAIAHTELSDINNGARFTAEPPPPRVL